MGADIVEKRNAAGRTGLLLSLAAALCLGPLQTSGFAATAYNGIPVQSGEEEYIRQAVEMDAAAAMDALAQCAAELSAREETAKFDPQTRCVTADASAAASGAVQGAKKTYVVRVSAAAFADDNPINIILPGERDNIIINLDGLSNGEQYKFRSPLRFNGKDVPQDGRKSAGRVLLNFGGYAANGTGFLDFWGTDGIAVLAPNAVVKYPCTRVEMVVRVGPHGMYSAEVPKNGVHSAALDEGDILAPLDFRKH